MSSQPNQSSLSSTFANGVLTSVIKLYVNGSVATSLDDDNNTVVTTVDGTSAGVVTITVEVTPDTPITSEDETIYSNVRNAESPNA